MPRTTARDFTGFVSGRLTAIEATPRRSGNNVVWRCQCSCGGVAYVSSNNLGKQQSRSCGCLKRERARTHGETSHRAASREYSVWASMRRRCDNPNNPRFARYGGRGIKVCERWTSFANFLADMGRCPEGLTLERKNTDGDYEPDNCEWASYAVQNRNTSQNVWLTLNGTTLCLKDWSDRTGIRRDTLNGRLHRGWSVERALTTPPHHGPQLARAQESS